MQRRCRLAVLLVALFTQLLAPAVAYAVPGPATFGADYCSAAERSLLSYRGDAALAKAPLRGDSQLPAPRPAHTAHQHCASCCGASVAPSLPASATPLSAHPRALVRVRADPPRIGTGSQSVLLPPLRGPPILV